MHDLVEQENGLVGRHDERPVAVEMAGLQKAVEALGGALVALEGRVSPALGPERESPVEAQRPVGDGSPLTRTLSALQAEVLGLRWRVEQLCDRVEL